MQEAFAPDRWDFVPGPSLVSGLAISADLEQCVINQKDGPEQAAADQRQSDRHRACLRSCGHCLPFSLLP